MKLLLGSLLLGGLCWLGAAMRFPTFPNFDSQRIAGTWNPLANIVIERQFPQYNLTAGTDGDVIYSVRYLDDGECKEGENVFAELDAPGKYRTSAPTFLQILDTDYDTYIITAIVRGMDSFLTLAGKADTLTPDLKRKFTKFANSIGVKRKPVPVVLKENC